MQGGIHPSVMQYMMPFGFYGLGGMDPSQFLPGQVQQQQQPATHAGQPQAPLFQPSVPLEQMLRQQQAMNSFMTASMQGFTPQQMAGAHNQLQQAQSQAQQAQPQQQQQQQQPQPAMNAAGIPNLQQMNFAAMMAWPQMIATLNQQQPPAPQPIFPAPTQTAAPAQPTAPSAQQQQPASQQGQQSRPPQYQPSPSPASQNGNLYPNLEGMLSSSAPSQPTMQQPAQSQQINNENFQQYPYYSQDRQSRSSSTAGGTSPASSSSHYASLSPNPPHMQALPAQNGHRSHEKTNTVIGKGKRSFADEADALFADMKKKKFDPSGDMAACESPYALSRTRRRQLMSSLA
jgi:hypothetical protein